MLIDFHTHCFPDYLAKTALEKLSFLSGGLQYYTDGTLLGLRHLMEQQSVEKAVVLSIATNAGQQKKVNDFAAALNKQPELVAFGSVFPDAPDALEELERIKALGLKGVKFHPDYQGFSAEEDRMIPIYRKISSLGLITVFHAGCDYAFSPPYGGKPEKLQKALSHLDTTVVVAHWGGINSYEETLKYLCGRDVYLDTSFGYAMLPKYFAQKILEKHTPQRVVFGSDAPWHTPEMELRLLHTLGLQADEMADITHRNGEKLLGYP